MAHDKILSSVNEFVVLPLHIPPVPSFPQSAIHYLYLRAHAPKLTTPETARQLFLVNVPIDATESQLFTLFAKHCNGVRVETVAFERARVGKGISAPVAPVEQAPPSSSRKRKRDADTTHITKADAPTSPSEVGQLPSTILRPLHRSGSTAIVTFIDKPSAQIALTSATKLSRAKTSPPTVIWPPTPSTKSTLNSDTPPLGLSRYTTHHHLRHPSHTHLQQITDAYMTAYSAHETALAASAARLRSEPDADGFITVTRTSGRTSAREDVEAMEREAARKKRAEKKRVGEGFYRFQQREMRKEVGRELVRGFEEDIRRVGEMRRRREGGGKG